jgi:UDP:flavonoid glycosyltransferase YjiC (YdhE family)
VSQTSQSRRILAFPYSHTLSHLSRPLLIAIELQKRNIEVIFAGEKQSLFVKQNAFEMVSVYEPDPQQLYGNIRNGKLRFVSNDEVGKMIEADLELYRRVHPDLVLSDGRFTAPISAHIAGLKHVAIVNVSSTEYRALPYVPVFDWIPKSIVTREGRLWRHIEKLNLYLEMAIFNSAMRIFSEHSKKLGLKTNITATNCLTGKDFTLLADIPEYFPTRNLPSNYQYIGPLTLKADIKPPAWWPPKKRRGGLVYITMGTTGIGEFFRIIHELIQRTELTVVASTGGQIGDLSSIDGIIYLEEYLNGDLVMDMCDLVVCHGGNGTIYQALQHGKPIIGIPTIPDQKFNMRRVESLGVGKTIGCDEFVKRPDVLLEAIAYVTGTRVFAQNARRMKSLIDRYDGGRLGADIVERMLTVW